MRFATLDAVVTLARAPITEAIIDLKVDAPEGLQVGAFGKLQAAESSKYPETSAIMTLNALLRGGDEVGSSAKQSWVGIRIRNQRFVAQAQLGGFTFSRLAPYDTWDEFRSEAQRLWGIYREIAQPTRVTRIAVRYINRLEIPAGHEIKSYLRTFPELSPSLPQVLDGFFLQLKVPDRPSRRTLVINEGYAPEMTPGKVSLILDIDLFLDSDVPNDESAIWSEFERMRTRKNEVFFASLTQKMLEELR